MLIVLQYRAIRLHGCSARIETNRCGQVTRLGQLTGINCGDLGSCLSNLVTTSSDRSCAFEVDAELLFNSTKSLGNYTEAVKMLIKNSTNEGIFKIDPEAIFAKETYMVVWKYLSMVYEGESLTEMGKNPFDNNDHQNDEEWIALKNVLLPNIAAFNITLDQLKSTFDGKFKKVENYKDADCLLQLGDVLSTDCSSSGQNIIFIGTDHLCFKVHGQKIVYSPDDDYGVVTQPVVSLFFDNIKELIRRNSSLTIDFSGRWSPPDLSITKNKNEIIEYKPDQQIGIHITPPTVTKSMANKNGKRVCSNEYTLMECLDECRIQLIQNMCGCQPATLPSRDQNNTNKLCTFEKYEKCLNYVGNEDSECKAQCVPHCEKWKYEYDVDLVLDSWPEPVAFFFSDSFFYVVYTEIPKWSFEEFIGALGGALGLFLGLDFLVLIRFISSPIFMLVRRCFASKNAVVSIEIPHIQESTGEKSCFGKFWEFIKKHVSPHDLSSASMYITYLIEKLFWIVLYTTGGIYTTYLCYGLCQQYAEQPIYSSIVLMNNKTVTLPKPTLCMDNYGMFVKKVDKIINRNTAINYTNFLTEYFDEENITRFTLLDENDWPLPVLAVVSQYLSLMNTAEANGISSALYPTEINGYYNIQLTYEDYLKKLSKSTRNDMKNAMENVLETGLKRLNVSIDKVRLKLGREIAKLVRMKINFISADSTTISLINETKLTFFGYNSICFQLPFDTVVYSDASEFIEVSTDMTTYPIINGIFQIVFDAYLTEPEWNKAFNEFGKLFMVSMPGQNNSFSVGISGQHKMIFKENENAECTAASTKEVCLATCRIHLIQALCNCTPITWSTLLTLETDLCSLPEYKQCLNYSRREDWECREKCAYPCERYNFFYEETKGMINKTATQLYGTANLRIYVKDFAYVLFEDRLQWSFGDFLAALGGTLDLWLGLNIYTIVNLFIIIPVSLIASLCARTKMMRNKLTPIRTYSEERVRVLTSIPAVQIFCQIFNLDNRKLAQILTAKWIMENILTTIYYLIGSILTYQMCMDIILKYGTETESSYNFTENDTINFNSYPTICSPHSLGQNLWPLNQTADQNVNEEMIELFRDLVRDKDGLLLGNLTWPLPLLHTAISLIAFCGKYERIEWHQQIHESDYDQSISISQLQVFEDILMHLNAIDTNIYNLMQKCGREVRKADISILRLHQPDKGFFQEIEISETTYIDDTTICYRLPFNKFSSPTEYIELNVSLNRSDKGKSTSSNEVGPVNIDLLGREKYLEYGSVLFDSLISVKFGENVSTGLKIEAEYYALEVFNGIRRCSDAISQEDCKRNCKLQAVRQLCSCSPLSLSNTTDEILKRCSMDQYRTCLPFTLNTSRGCMSECLRPCQRIRFSENKAFFNAIEPHQANLIIRMRSFNFPVANERPKWTPSKFQGSLGCALSLWIALDALIFVNVFFMIFVFIFRLYLVFRRIRQEQQGSALET